MAVTAVALLVACSDSAEQRGAASADTTAPAASTPTSAEAPKVGMIEDMSALAHPVCSVEGADGESGPRGWIFAEGDVCPEGGGDCVANGLIHLDGRDQLVPRVTEGETSSTFRSTDGTLTVEVAYDLGDCPTDQPDCETPEGGAKVVVKRGEQQVEVRGEADCGD